MASAAPTAAKYIILHFFELVDIYYVSVCVLRQTNGNNEFICAYIRKDEA